jgi:hypothetical protein
MSNDNLIAAYLAKGGRVQRVKAALPQHVRGNSVARQRFLENHMPEAGGDTAETYRLRFEALLSQTDTNHRDAQYWAAYEIGPYDPHRALAEAAGLFVIAVTEGLESARCYEKALCHEALRGAT